MKSCTIIGQGIAGLAAGFRLLQRGVAVEFIGPEQTEMSASKAAVGVSAQKGVLIARDPLFQLKALGHENLPKWFNEIESVSGIKIGVNRFWGVSERPASHAEFQKIAERVYKRDFLGCYRVEIKFDEENNSSMLRYPEDYFFDVPSLFKSLRGANNILGATYIPLSVVDVSILNENYLINIGSQQIERSNVLMTAGFETKKFLDKLNISKHSLTGIAGRSFEFSDAGSDFCEVRGQHALVRAGGSVRVGSTSSPLTSNDSHEDLKVLQDAFSSFPFKNPIPRWGVRARFRDRQPRCGVLHEINAESKLWISCGFYKSGLQLSDLISKLLVRKMFGEFPESDLDFDLMKNFVW